jgi:hypothetical protein
MDNRKEAVRQIYKEDRGIKKMGSTLALEFEQWFRENGQTVSDARVDARELELNEEEQRQSWMAERGIKKMGRLVRWQYETWLVQAHPEKNLPALANKLVERDRPIQDIEPETLEEAIAADENRSKPEVETVLKPRKVSLRKAGVKSLEIPFGLDDPAKLIMEEVRGKKLTWENRLVKVKNGTPHYETATVPTHPVKLSLTEHYDGRRTLTFASPEGFRSLELSQLTQVR